MKEFRIPVYGPGSQPEAAGEPALDYIRMPTSMRTYYMPALPDRNEASRSERALQFLAALQRTLESGDHHCRFDLGDFGRDDRDLVDQVLGSGEVSIVADSRLHIQESVLTGVWRVQEVDPAGRLVRDQVEIADFPSDARALAAGLPAADVRLPTATPAGVLNAPAVLTELLDKAASIRPGAAPHVINLTLLPQTPEDLEFLGQVLGTGRVLVLSRGYGNCRVTSTATQGIWWVQYFNSQDALVLNTIEVVDVPEVARAAPEDLADSATRLDRILDVYR